MDYLTSLLTWIEQETNQGVVYLLLAIAATLGSFVAWILRRPKSHSKELISDVNTSPPLSQLTSYRIPSNRRLDNFYLQCDPLRLPKERGVNLLYTIGLARKKRLTGLGVLFLHNNPQSVYPSGITYFVHYNGNSESSSAIAREPILGPIHSQIKTAERLLESAIGVGETASTDRFRVEHCRAYSIEILRETLFNAICHRDYQDLNRNVGIHVYSNRIEILSPGNWCVESKQLSEAEHVSISELISKSVSRNGNFPYVLYYLGYVEKAGSGIKRICDEARNNNIPIPTVDYVDGYIIVTIYAQRNNVDEMLRRRSTVLDTVDQTEQLSHPPHVVSTKVLHAKERIKYLVARNRWNGNQLLRILNESIENGESTESIVKPLLDNVNIKSSVRDVGSILYAGEQSGVLDDDTELFDRWQRPRVEVSPQIGLCRAPPTGDSRRFCMGESAQENCPQALPRHWVTLSAFYISETPVTEEQYSYFDPKKNCNNPDNPVVNVSWWEAWLYCRWANGSLPSEAQWEFACRAGTSTIWSFGNDEKDIKEWGWVEDDPEPDAEAVKQKHPNQWGLYDVHGNVHEWCLDCFYEYPTGHHQDPVSIVGGGHRVLRGGSIINTPSETTSASRKGANPDTAANLTSFRIIYPVSS